MYRISLIILTLVSLVLMSCSEDVVQQQDTASSRAPRAKKKAAAGKEVKAEEEEVVPVYSYDPIGKRDPFLSPLTTFNSLEGAEEQPLTPLQRYDIEQFRLSGVVLGLSVPKAMVKSPDGKNYILAIGTKIGKNGGKVVKINNEGVLVEEILRDFSGETRINSVLIALPKRKGV